MGQERREGAPFNADKLQLVFSATKGAAVFSTALMVELGLLGIARPVAYYWPDFAREGKRDVPASWRALAAQRPMWEPGLAEAVTL